MCHSVFVNGFTIKTLFKEAGLEKKEEKKFNSTCNSIISEHIDGSPSNVVPLLSHPVIRKSNRIFQ